MSSWLADNWPYIASLVGAGAGGAGGLKLIDKQQNKRLTELEKRIDDVEIDLREHKDEVKDQIQSLTLDVKLNGERDKANQEKIIIKLENIVKNQESQQKQLDEWRKLLMNQNQFNG